MNYYEQKAKHAHELFLKGLPFKRVYAVVEKDGKYLCLEHDEKARYKYSLSGGGIDEGEDSITAIKRELLEEMNVCVDIVRSLGHAYYVKTWEYQGEKFDANYDAEVFLTKFIKYGDNKKFGLDGEFGRDILGIAAISKEEMLQHVAEFSKLGIKLDDAGE